jgi:hypothetical protein
LGVLAGSLSSYSLGIRRKATYAAIRAVWSEAAAVVTFMSIVVGVGMAMISYASQQYLAAYCVSGSQPVQCCQRGMPSTPLCSKLPMARCALKLSEPNYWLFILAGFLLLQMMELFWPPCGGFSAPANAGDRFQG